MIINVADRAPRPVSEYEKATLPHNVLHIDSAGHGVTKSLEETYTKGGYVYTSAVERENAQEVEEKPCNKALDLEQEMSNGSFRNLAVETGSGPIKLYEEIAEYPGNVNNNLDKI